MSKGLFVLIIVLGVIGIALIPTPFGFLYYIFLYVFLRPMERKQQQMREKEKKKAIEKEMEKEVLNRPVYVPDSNRPKKDYRALNLTIKDGSDQQIQEEKR